MPTPTELTLAHARLLVPPRPRDGHKGTFGHLLLIAGARGFSGAVRLAAEAGMRSGVGLATAAIPRPIADIVAASLLEVMTHALPATEEETLSLEALQPALELARTRDAAALGPGLSQHHETTMFVRAFAAQCPVPLVLDADGLNALGKDPSHLRARTAPTVVTPHPGEMARLLGCPIQEVQADREGSAAAYAEASGAMVVLKGHHTLIAKPGGPVTFCARGNSGMATGGTGDVLTGLTGGLLAQGMEAHAAASLAVFLHATAGDIAAARKTERALIARDVIEALPDAWREVDMSPSRP
jgi:hydroxyethylthiazole kinase-like uncharacterized protein yjeF